jgi:hypothetical protein
MFHEPDTENKNTITMSTVVDDDDDELESQVNEPNMHTTAHLNQFQISWKKNNNEMKRMDPDFHSMVKTVNNKNKRIEMYSTSINSGRKIREAISGLYSNFRTGTYDENLFFKVRMTTFGSVNTNIVLYYYSIDDFERHQKTKVSDKVRAEWSNKRAFREKELTAQ